MRHIIKPFAYFIKDEDHKGEYYIDCECGWKDEGNIYKTGEDDHSWDNWGAHVARELRKAKKYSLDIKDTNEVEYKYMNSYQAPEAKPMNLRQLIHALEEVADFVGDKMEATVTSDHEYFGITNVGFPCMADVVYLHAENRYPRKAK